MHKFIKDIQTFSIGVMVQGKVSAILKSNIGTKEERNKACSDRIDKAIFDIDNLGVNKDNKEEWLNINEGIISPPDANGNVYLSIDDEINKEDAIKIIKHLTKVFDIYNLGVDKDENNN